MDVLEALRTLTVWIINGVLAAAFTAADHGFALLALGGMAFLLARAPAAQRPFLLSAAGLAALAAFLAPPPVPAILAAETIAGAFAVRIERFNPDALRWRAATGIALYALAALGYRAYAAYAGSLAVGEAASLAEQGRAFLETAAAWGLWLVLPLAYFGMLAQAVLAHPPVPARPEEILLAVRSRKRP